MRHDDISRATVRRRWWQIRRRPQEHFAVITTRHQHRRVVSVPAHLQSKRCVRRFDMLSFTTIVQITHRIHNARVTFEHLDWILTRSMPDAHFAI